MIFRASQKGNLIPGWFWIFLIGFPLGIMGWWFLRWFFLPCHERTSAVVIEAPRSEGIRLPVEKDDFRKLKGIGPKTAAALYQLNIFTFEQLGLFDLEKFTQLLKENNIPIGSASFWQKQAIFAAAEDWEKLEKLQK